MISSSSTSLLIELSPSDVEQLYNTLGIGGLLIVLLIISAWIFIRRSVSNHADEISAKITSEFQLNQDKKIITFKEMKVKQLDVVLALYQHFNSITGMISYMNGNEKFVAPPRGK